MAAMTCAWCSAPRGEGDSCPKCGANYAKAELLKKEGRPVDPGAPKTTFADPMQVTKAEAARLGAPVPLAATSTVAIPVQDGERDEEGLLVVDDPKLEFWFCVAAIPAMLLLGVLFQVMMTFVQHTFLAMPVHELGHAVTAWFTGHWAIPTLWKTPHAETRGVIMPILLFGALGYVVFLGWKRSDRGLMALGGALIVLQMIGTFVLKQQTAQMLIVWGGDGMGIILATALMAAFFFGKKTDLYKGSLRWGFVAIGAGAFVDLYAIWWAARTDFGRVPFGEQEGGNLSDATKLVDGYHWDTKVMITRYVTLGILCLAVLAAIYAWGVWQAWKKYSKAT